MKNSFFYFLISILFFSCQKDELQSDEKLEEKIEFKAGYVVNGGSNSISIIDIDKQKIVDSILLGKPSGQFFAHHISISPDKKLLAVAIPQANFINHSTLHSTNAATIKGGILIIDRLKKQVIAELEVPNINFDILFSPDGSEIWTMSNIEKGEAFIFDSKTFALKKQFSVGASPSNFAFSKNGKYAFTALTHSTYIQVIDVLNKEVIKSIKVDNQPTNVWMGEKYLYVENTDLKLINIIDPENLIGIKTLNLDFNPGEIIENQSMNQIWICHAFEGAISVFENTFTGLSLIKKIELNQKPHSITMNENKEALVVSTTANKLSFINAKTLTVSELKLGSNPNCLLIVNP